MICWETDIAYPKHSGYWLMIGLSLVRTYYVSLFILMPVACGWSIIGYDNKDIRIYVCVRAE